MPTACPSISMEETDRPLTVLTLQVRSSALTPEQKTAIPSAVGQAPTAARSTMPTPRSTPLRCRDMLRPSRRTGRQTVRPPGESMISIIGQPNNLTVAPNATAEFTVSANASIGGTVLYQWYSHTVNRKTGGTKINGATSAAYRAPTNTSGVTYYYCVATSPARPTWRPTQPGSP